MGYPGPVWWAPGQCRDEDTVRPTEAIIARGDPSVFAAATRRPFGAALFAAHRSATVPSGFANAAPPACFSRGVACSPEGDSSSRSKSDVCSDQNGTLLAHVRDPNVSSGLARVLVIAFDPHFAVTVRLV